MANYYFTKWSETLVVGAATAEVVAEFLLKQVVLRHGPPCEMCSDQGKCFTAGVVRSLNRMMETNHRVTAPYHPQANGLVERLNHTLSSMLSMYVNSEHTDWDCFVPFITFAYNTSVQQSTGRTPFYLVYGREARIPLEVMRGHAGAQEASGEDALKSLQRAREFVQQKLAICQQDQKDYYDQRKRPAELFAVDDYVLVYKPIRKIGKSEKLLHRWHGPYRIIAQTDALNYEVKRPRAKKSEIIHVKDIKRYRLPLDWSDAEEDEAEPVPTLPAEQRKPDASAVPAPAEPKQEEPRPLEPPPQSDAGNSGARTRAQRVKRRPAWYGILTMLIMLMVVTASLEDNFLTEGVIFRHQGTVGFSDSEWVIVTDVSMSPISEALENLEQWMNNGRLVFAVLKPHCKRSAISVELQRELFLQCEPTSATLYMRDGSKIPSKSQVTLSVWRDNGQTAEIRAIVFPLTGEFDMFLGQDAIAILNEQLSVSCPPASPLRPISPAASPPPLLALPAPEAPSDQLAIPATDEPSVLRRSCRLRKKTNTCRCAACPY